MADRKQAPVTIPGPWGRERSAEPHGRRLLPALVALVCVGAIPAPVTLAATLAARAADGTPVDSITDGDAVELELRLPAPVRDDATVRFQLPDDGTELVGCTIPADGDRCRTPPFATLGWSWSATGRRQGMRTVRAVTPALPAPVSRDIAVAPRPVVLVHGFISSADTWRSYLGPHGYLAGLGIPGFAVGDARAAGVLETGSIVRPGEATDTIAGNAARLAGYIRQVREMTGAGMVDLVAHSMGGLIARHYIDRLMDGRDVAQLIMLGTPNGGSECAHLPVALGFYLPAALELRPHYLTEIFNRQVTRRHDVPFHQLAGTAITESYRAPCTGVPSDLVVSRASATAVPVRTAELPELHTAMTDSRRVFQAYVAPLLKTPAGRFEPAVETPAQVAATVDMQATDVFTGFVERGQSRTFTVHLDAVAVASFALFDSTRSLEVSVRGASGRTISLSPELHALRVVHDPDSLVYLGYGFENPSPGPWQVTVSAGRDTPARGAHFALSAQVRGGAALEATAGELLPRVGQDVEISARMMLGEPLPDAEISATILAPDGHEEAIALLAAGDRSRAVWTPRQPGLHGITVHARARTPAGWNASRTAFLAVEARAR